MVLIFFGVSLWILTHLTPGAAPGFKVVLVEKLGLGGYKGIFTVLLLVAIGLIVVGWRTAAPEFIYTPPAGLRSAAIVLILMAFLLMGASAQPSRIKQFIRHPQLTGLIAWSTAHLLLNGDHKSIVVFGGLGLWALIEIVLINRRDNEWQKPAVPSLVLELRTQLISLFIFGFLWLMHPYFAGVRIPTFMG